MYPKVKLAQEAGQKAHSKASQVGGELSGLKKLMGNLKDISGKLSSRVSALEKKGK